jgi:hypothetical protein
MQFHIRHIMKMVQGCNTIISFSSTMLINVYSLMSLILMEGIHVFFLFPSRQSVSLSQRVFTTECKDHISKQLWYFYLPLIKVWIKFITQRNSGWNQNHKQYHFLASSCEHTSETKGTLKGGEFRG